MHVRKSLTDILRNGDRDILARAWAETAPADDAPLPAGEYIARVTNGELFNARANGTPGYKLTFRVLEGEHQGRHLWHDIWLTPRALPMAKRDLARLGITTMEQLERPLPPGIRCRVRVALRRRDDGVEYNQVRSFEVVGIDEPIRDPFAPSEAEGDDRADAIPF